MITTYHNISFGTQTVPEQIPVVQGDTGREIVFILTDFTIPEGATATYYVQKPSGEAVYNTATISENNIIVPLTAQSIIEVGENDMQVRVILGEDIVTSFRAILMVRPFLGIGAVESSTEINIFDQAVEAAKEEITAAVGEAEDEIDTATEEAIAQVHESALSFFVTDTASGAIATFPDGADLVPVKSLTVEIEPVQSGSGDPSPSNVRPITGWSEAKVTRTGKNLLDPDVLTTFGSTYVSSIDYATEGKIPVKPSTQYVLSFSGSVGDGRILQYDVSGNLIGSATQFTSQPYYFTTDARCVSIGFRYKFTETSGATVADSKAQMEIGSTASSYEPYQGQTYEIDLDGTRYGGTLDVGTGVLTVTHGYVDMGTLNYNFRNDNGTRQAWETYISEIKTVDGETTPNWLCSAFKVSKYNASWVPGLIAPGNPNSTVIVVCVNSGQYDSTNPSAFKTAMNGVQLCYELASPLTVQLTAEEVTTLLGQNAVFADCGDVEVEYRADTKLYIDKLLNA